ncbi:Rpn family recombination-promoting nuclease/putative transposase [Pectobacterium quasiaquaticum]|uniref:Rpn family recombination-promoting nuclease/putative transposase n=1 Tax=Pectobacterium quasiaquaticum TaxID=2774015 RepID=UPI001874BF3A|nr:Rpn family recombination-promoting nuclease/putative transposase [Pectobacterium quasiaquaticum]URG51606.1 Rpn family recombination-promoting nuclease/putative transposase [Pectobacterium quasiaquaticum]
MKESNTSTPHDGIFKTFLTHLETAQDFLDIHLPPALRQVCDLHTLHLESGSFIEENLRTYFADVLYSLHTASGEGYIYCLIEHQSSSDSHMAFRLMRYAVAAMQRHLDAGHKTLPLVIPLLFCHGRASPWPFSINWLSLFSEPEIARQLYTGAFPLVDVGVLDDDNIMQHLRMAMLELLLKHIRQRDLVDLTEQLVTLLLDGYTTGEQLVTLLNWMLQTGDTSEPELFLQTLVYRSPQHEEVLMTIAQKLEQKARIEGHTEGLAEGMTEGLNKGMSDGRLEGKREVARAMLENGIDRFSVMRMTGLSSEELEQVKH